MVGDWNPETREWMPVDPEDGNVKYFWKTWRDDMKMMYLESSEGVDKRRLVREKPVMGNQQFNEFAYESARTLNQWIKLGTTQDPPPDWQEQSDIQSDMKEMLFDMANSIVEKSEDKKVVSEFISPIWDRCLERQAGRDWVQGVIDNPRAKGMFKTQKMMRRSMEKKGDHFKEGAEELITTLPKIYKKKKKMNK